MPAKPLGLTKRMSRFYYRRTVPERLQPIIGRKTLIRKLDTSDYREAVRRVAYVAAEVQAEFDRASNVSEPSREARLRSLSEISEADLRQIVRDWVEAQLRRHERDIYGGSSIDPEHIQIALEDAYNSSNALKERDLHYGASLIEELLVGDGIAIEREDPRYGSLCNLALRAISECKAVRSP